MTDLLCSNDIFGLCKGRTGQSLKVAKPTGKQGLDTEMLKSKMRYTLYTKQPKGGVKIERYRVDMLASSFFGFQHMRL